VAEVLDTALELTVVGSFSRVGYAARRRLFDWEEPRDDALEGRVALVTGASSGLGLAAAGALASAGATVIVLGRDQARTDRARAEIATTSGRDDVQVAIADLSRLADVRRVADELLARHDRLDVVVHNAGTLVHDHVRTDDGLELTAQTHVVAPFLLTARLYPLLAATGGARVITVTSGGMYTSALDLESLDRPPEGDDFDGVKAYARAKRAQVVLTGCWARRTHGSGIAFHAMHPGWADTAGLSASLPRFHRLVRPILRTPAQGVDTTVWLAAAPEALTHNGSLWLDRHRRRAVYLPGTATSTSEADRLWAWCCERADEPDPTI
jgi:NAD(P)-dependent dehydrogenase (short-subunit alcohol dehydrogenase family)